MTERRTHLIVCRATIDAGTDVGHVEVKIGFAGEPTPQELSHYDESIRKLFAHGFGREPERVAVVVLPWVWALDADEDEERDD